DEPGARAHLALEPLGAHPLADRRGLARLPDDRAVDRLAAAAIPHDRRLALVRDADRGHVGGGRARLGQRLARRAQLAVPDLRGIVLDPAGLREVLRELVLRDRGDPAVALEEQRARGGRALVEGEQVAAHAARSAPLTRRPRRRRARRRTPRRGTAAGPRRPRPPRPSGPGCRTRPPARPALRPWRSRRAS